MRKARRLRSLEKASVDLGVRETPKTPTEIQGVMSIGNKKTKLLPRKGSSRLIEENRFVDLRIQSRE